MTEVAQMPDIVQNGKPKRMGRLNVELGSITQHNIMQLKKLNEAVFPVAYNSRFYKDVVTSGDLGKFVFFNDCVVGAVCCRIDIEEGVKKLYIMTLGTLAPYRRLGIGSMLLNHVFSLCEKDKGIKSVTLHVQINNESALDFYQKFGFQKSGVAENYYKRIEPSSAYILEKEDN
ncbi:unnamed protein product [Bursaphelenchus okinawaensis]|uniref:N-terminal methionine N(alpha)-acetyltransferase NatE n=1 Tax=Bursaphelenchus okinawaensis TaxID=465554 RepID=A0A811JSY0_9BILA|nr:unnamed protein product [Bursaphelenchus okinawaensis]CAG9082245.1 unnamed protein product [Bursaphelenchus okinawaensis]